MCQQREGESMRCWALAWEGEALRRLGGGFCVGACARLGARGVRVAGMQVLRVFLWGKGGLCQSTALLNKNSVPGSAVQRLVAAPLRKERCSQVAPTQ